MATLPMVIEQPRLTAYELSQTPEFALLTPKQAHWVLYYAQTFLDDGRGDPVAATRVSFDCASEETARTLTYQVMAKPRVVIALNRFFGNSPTQAFLDLCLKAANNPRVTSAQVQALAVFCTAAGLDKSALAQVDAEKAELIAQVRQQLAEAEKGSVAAQRLMAQLERLTTIKDARPMKEPGRPGRPRKYRVGQLEEQDGVLYRIDEVDDAGKVVKATEVPNV